MSISFDPVALRLVRTADLPAESTIPTGNFEEIRAAIAPAPLIEVLPAAFGDHAATLGFALAWALLASDGGLIFWAAPEQDFFEDGLPNAEGLAQFGLPLDRLLLVRAASQKDALWATEQALATAGIFTLCAISPSKKGLSLNATRRLLLTAEQYKSRCLLLRLDSAGSSAARARFQVSSLPSDGEAHELGPPAFSVHLARNRAGPSNLTFNLRWSVGNHAFQALDGPVAATSVERPHSPVRAGRAG